ncbi:two-component regulator propeller domain-containing protein [Thalassobellus suaedae]|uniref:histidine kinase n=1 Tax=Thalassobellus suaedae TaxID=3074124 RepID=A0ABY9XYY0_9FLAO|nr:two-component regulator propeller domain-containing protein [Flavobacteriaceae bacterium HL-DH10]
MIKNTFIFLFCLLNTCIVYCQDSQLPSKSIEDILTFHLLDVESGLSNNYVNSVEQDSLGFIWVATIEGINRYDGTSFTKFKKEYQNQESSLINNHVEQITADDHGNLLLATDEGLNIYDTKHETFKVLKHNGKAIENAISSFVIGPNNELVVGASRHHWGIQFIDKDGNLQTFSHQPNNASSISSNNVSSLTVQGDSILWIGTTDRGLNRFNFNTKTITRIPYGENSALPSLKINSLYTDSKDNLWIGSVDGLQVLTTKGDTLGLKASSFSDKGLSGNSILSFEEDNQGQMWIGTLNGGLNILDISSFLSKKDRISIKWFLPKTDGSSVFNRTVSSIKMDKEGNMWLGTSTGLNFVNPKGEPIKLFHKNIETPNALSHDRIGAFTEKKDGKIWIGTDGGGLNLFDPTTGEFWYYQHDPNDKHSLSNDYVLSLLEDKESRVWIGTYRGGLNKMDIETGHCKHYLQGNTEDGSDIRKIFEDNTGQIWVGTNRGGLFKYIEEKDQFDYIESLGKIDIRDIRNGDNGSLWLATYGDGIIKYKPNNDNATFYKIANTRGMTSDVIYCLLPIKNGDILAGTRYGGLIRLNPKTHTCLSFTENDGLSNNSVNSIVMENEIDIWLGTFEGISHYNIITNKIDNLNTFNNIQRSEFNIGAALKSKNRYLYFGGNKGFNMFNPKNLHKDRTQTYPIVFENMQILNKKVPVTPNHKKAILENSISYQDHITLNHDQTMFSVDFVVLKFPVAKNINYSYLLEGYHNHWIDTKSNGSANLSNVPPGNYTLKVKAKLGSGQEVYNQLLVSITPPFWRTVPAYILYLLLIAATIFVGMKYYSNHIKLKNSLLFEKKQRQLEHDFNEERIRFFTSFSHELRTPLTLILGPVNDMIPELRNKKHADSMRLIKKNATYLFQSINKLLEFRKSEVGLSDLFIGKHNLSSVLKQLIDNYLLMAKKKGIKLSLTLPKKDLIAWFDIEKVQIIVNNLLSNAFKYSKDKGEIKVSLIKDEAFFKIIVNDNGSGIHPKDLDHIFEWYYQSKSLPRKKGSGIGLALSKNFAELHKGKLAVESELNKGSVFTFSIPRDESLFSMTPIDNVNREPSEEVDISPLNAWGPTAIKVSEEKIKTTINPHEDRLVILVIDDNPDILKYLEGLLDNHYDILYAENGQEGIDKAIQYVPDLIISDIMMPKKSGIDLCEILKKEMTTTHIPIILLSAKNNIESIKTGYITGADDYIVKPFNSQLLQVRIKNLINSRMLLRKYFLEQAEPLETFSKEQSNLLDKEKEFLRKLDGIILIHMREEKTSVNDIVIGIGMSRTSLFRKIKAITGKNINEYINMVKIKKAANLIKNENLSISQAAFEVGFNSPKYFRQLFKKQFGVVPSDYKKSTKNIE